MDLLIATELAMLSPSPAGDICMGNDGWTFKDENRLSKDRQTHRGTCYTVYMVLASYY